MPRIRRINTDCFLKLSAPIRSIRADPRSIAQWLFENALGRTSLALANTVVAIHRRPEALAHDHFNCVGDTRMYFR
jgi:hypothetical protein